MVSIIVIPGIPAISHRIYLIIIFGIAVIAKQFAISGSYVQKVTTVILLLLLTKN